MIEKILKKVISQLIEEHQATLISALVAEIKKAIMSALKDPNTIREVAEAIGNVKKGE